MNESPSRDLISRYLLGSLSETDARQVAEDCFLDEEKLTLLENTEEELIEQYVRGRLNSDERRLFEKNFLITEERRMAVQFERMLVACQARDSERILASGKPSLRTTWNALTTWGRAAIAAGLFAAVVGESLIIRDWMTARSLLPESGSFSRTLFPVVSRGPSQERVVLSVPSKQQTVCLILDARLAATRRYRIELQDGDRTLWRQGKVSPSSYQGAPVLVILIPTGLLKDKQSYRVLWAPEDDPSDPEYRDYVIGLSQ